MLRTKKNGQPDQPTPKQLTEHGTDTLHEAGCSEAYLDASALVRIGLGAQDFKEILDRQDKPVTPEEAIAVAALIARRAKREPMEYIVGGTRFGELWIATDERALVPDEASLAMLRFASRLRRGDHFHEVGAGCGAISLAVKHAFPHLKVSGSDISAEAIELARENAERLGVDVTFTVAPWLPEGGYDMIAANLPYVDRDMGSLEIPPEYTDHQPPVAVWTGEEEGDGLTLIREFVERISPTAAIVVLQHAPSQTYTVRDWFRNPETIANGEPYARITAGPLL